MFKSKTSEFIQDCREYVVKHNKSISKIISLSFIAHPYVCVSYLTKVSLGACHAWSQRILGIYDCLM